MTEIKKEIDKLTIIVGYLNTPLSVTDKTSSQKIIGCIENLKQLELMGNYRTLCQITA